MTDNKIEGLISYEIEAKYEENPDQKILTFENGDYPDEERSESPDSSVGSFLCQRGNRYPKRCEE